jgi:hypothetical protein
LRDGLFVGCAEAGSSGSVGSATGASNLDSSTLIVGLMNLLGARASLFGNLVAGCVSDPCFENVRMDTTPRNVCNAGDDGRLLDDETKGSM